MKLLGWLRRPEVRRAPLRSLARRAGYEIDRRIRPRSLAGEREVTLPDDGVVMIVTRDDVIERSIWLFGYHEPVSADVWRRLCFAGMCAIDVGAHAGQYALIAARRAGPGGAVIAVEPNPVTRARLLRNVGRNRGLAPIAVEEVALSDAPGSAVLRHPAGAPDNPGMSSLLHIGPAEEMPVVVDTLDALVERRALRGLDLVKIDVEGNEAAVLAGASATLRRWHPSVMFEADDALFGREKGFEVLERLRRAGYEIYGMRGGRLVTIAETPLQTFREGAAALNLVAIHPDRRPRYDALLA